MPSEAAGIGRHLEACPSCAADAALEAGLRGAFGAMPGTGCPVPGRAEGDPELEGSQNPVRPCTGHPARSPQAERAHALWARIARAAFEAPVSATATRVRADALPMRRRYPLRLVFPVVPLVAALLLAGRLAWQAERSDSGLPTEPGLKVSIDLTLWESQPAAADPMGPTTQGLLAVLEGES